MQVRAQHLPGHTAGHCALLVENEGLAFIGDIDLSGFGFDYKQWGTPRTYGVTVRRKF